jgi:hypothetical protein
MYTYLLKSQSPFQYVPHARAISHFSESEYVSGSNGLHLVGYCGSHCFFSVINTQRAGHLLIIDSGGINTVGLSLTYMNAIRAKTDNVVTTITASFIQRGRCSTSIVVSTIS